VVRPSRHDNNTWKLPRYLKYRMKRFAPPFLRPAALIRLFLLLVFVAMPVIAAEVTEDPLERQTLEIASQLRCAVCQNESVADSKADLAGDMRKIIREQLKAGKSRDEIINYFVARYGNYVLMKPPTQGAGGIIWAAPVVLLVVVGLSGFIFLRRRLRPSLPPPPELSKEDVARVRAARKQQNT
jgi:cytochrome c-type biogenesis protein CcmH